MEEIYYYVNDDIVTKLDFEEAYGLAEKDPRLQQLDPHARSNAVISNLVTESVLAYHAEFAGIYIRQEDVTAEVARVMRQNRVTNEEQFKLILEQQGLTREIFERRLKRTLLMQRYVGRKLEGTVPSEHELEAYYAEHKESEFKIIKPLHYLAWVLFAGDLRKSFSARKAVQAKAEQVRAAVFAGELDFAEAVNQYSEDDASKLNGGIIGWVRAANLPIAEAAFAELSAVPIGGVTKLYSSTDGVFFYRIEDRMSSGYVPLTVAARDIREILSRQQRNKEFTKVVKELFALSYIKANVEHFDITF